MMIGFLGSEGSYHSKAVRPLLSEWRAEPRGVPTARALVAAVEDGTIDCGLLAVETNLNGLIGPHLRAIVAGDVQVCGEVVYEARMALLGAHDLDFDSVRAVHSHPEALAECDLWLTANVPRASRVPTDSSSAGVADACLHAGNVAAIAGPDAGHAAGLVVLADDIADPPGDITRFWLLAPAPAKAAEDHDRTLLLIDPAGGDLTAAHAVIAESDLDISRMDGITARAGLGEYRLLVEVARGGTALEVERLLDRLADVATTVRLLGSYRSALIPPRTPFTDQDTP